MLLLFEKLFGMKFCAVEASAWHESVGVYQVWNSSCDGGDFLGWLYTDVFNREGKRQNALHYMMKPVSDKALFFPIQGWLMLAGIRRSAWHPALSRFGAGVQL
jgi:Zn-dependent oligopeptidase